MKIGLLTLASTLGLVTGGAHGAETPLAVAANPDGSVRLSWLADTRDFELESTSALGTAWTVLQPPDLRQGTNGAWRTLDDLRPGPATRFYRLRAVEAPGPVREPTHDIGRPAWLDRFVDAQNGHDENDGTSRARAFRTLEAAWRTVTATPGTDRQAIRFRLLPGIHRGAYLEDRRGTREFPALIEPADGPGTVRLRPTPQGDAGSLQFLNCAHVYVQDFHIDVDGGDSLHFERCDQVLVRRMVLNSRRTEGQDETLKVNQCQHVYIEDSEIRDAGDNCIDVVATQYGHIVRCRIHNANDWGAYLKGGSAYWRVEGNEIYDCGTGGFTAGQGTGFQFMVPPWLHYEAYDVKIVNNLVHDTQGAGLGVNGGYNILLAHNTLYRVGSRSHLVEFVHGRRGCDGNDVAACQPYVTAGGWGTTGEEEGYLPNRNLQFVNNLIYNPPGFRSEYQHFEIAGPAIPPPGSNVPSPSRTDDGLVIRGNVIFNGPPDMLLGIEDEGRGCQDAQCNAARLRADNRINVFEPDLVDPAHGDFRPRPAGTLATLTVEAPSDFGWADAPARPAVPAGDPSNRVTRDFAGRTRPTLPPPGAFLP